MIDWLFEPGLFVNHSVLTAMGVGAVVATVSAVVGIFTVLRGQSFAGRADRRRDRRRRGGILSRVGTPGGIRPRGRGRRGRDGRHRRAARQGS
jgi:hypothetical protein